MDGLVTMPAALKYGDAVGGSGVHVGLGLAVKPSSSSSSAICASTATWSSRDRGSPSEPSMGKRLGCLERCSRISSASDLGTALLERVPGLKRLASAPAEDGTVETADDDDDTDDDMETGAAEETEEAPGSFLDGLVAVARRSETTGREWTGAIVHKLQI
jgi:hypothetical protein